MFLEDFFCISVFHTPSAVVPVKKKYKLRDERARLEMSFLNIILRGLQEESEVKEDAAMEKAMSVTGWILTQEIKSIYEYGGLTTWWTESAKSCLGAVCGDETFFYKMSLEEFSSVWSLERGYNRYNRCPSNSSQWEGEGGKHERERENNYYGESWHKNKLVNKMQTRNQRHVLSHYSCEGLQIRMADSSKPYWLCKTELNQLRKGSVGCDGKRLTFDNHWFPLGCIL